ncbi:MAG: HAMP domain-containing histidine kinase [Myxococcales bacterium]|nr:HAMP domain-containing histidine kinase [Myxococcales bacterium]
MYRKTNEHSHLLEVLETMSQAQRSVLAEIQSAQHEINNKLQSIVLDLYMLERLFTAQSKDSQVNQLLNMLSRVSEQAQQSIRSLKEIPDFKAAAFSQVSLENWGRAWLEATEQVREEFSGVTFHLQVDEGWEGAFWGGSQKLVLLLQQILLNACEGDGQSGAQHIWIHGTKKQEMHCFEIFDDGPGFPMEWVEQGAWLPFQTKKEGRLGLGLYWVERALRASRGRLSLTNRSEGGAHLTIAVYNVLPPSLGS